MKVKEKLSPQEVGNENLSLMPMTAAYRPDLSLCSETVTVSEIELFCRSFWTAAWFGYSYIQQDGNFLARYSSLPHLI